MTPGLLQTNPSQTTLHYPATSYRYAVWCFGHLALTLIADPKKCRRDQAAVQSLTQASYAQWLTTAINPFMLTLIYQKGPHRQYNYKGQLVCTDCPQLTDIKNNTKQNIQILQNVLTSIDHYKYWQMLLNNSVRKDTAGQ